MIINKLSDSASVPYKYVKGSISERRQKADTFLKNLYQNIRPKFKDDYSLMSYSDLQKSIQEVLPDKRFSILVHNISPEDQKTAYAVCEALFNSEKTIKAHSINMDGIGQTIRATLLPAFMHEAQHIADDIFHPKIVSRMQKLNKKGLDNKKYKDFFYKHYYCDEFIESKQDKKDVLKIIKHKTKKFLRGFSTQDKMDYIQDIRYALKSEINAYKRQVKIANDLKNSGLKMHESEFYEYDKHGIYKEKIQLLKDLAMEYMTKERAKHACKIKNK